VHPFRFVLSFGFLFAAGVLCSAKPPADLQARLEAFAKNQPGGVVVAWVDVDGPVFFATGKYSADDSRSLTADTHFEIGSVSKVFTALLLAESERLGKVARTDPAAKYLLAADDPIQPKLARITLASLATHM
jgi:D-alanyl-D-alanine-carboxypeptidase/D-alanyl-D-alanine-endopeptidase